MDSSDELLYLHKMDCLIPGLVESGCTHLFGKTAKWINKLIAEYDSGRVLEASITGYTISRQQMVSKVNEIISGFPDERILFLDAQGRPQPRPKHGNAIFYLGQNCKRFKQVLEQLAVLVVLFKRTLGLFLASRQTTSFCLELSNWLLCSSLTRPSHCQGFRYGGLSVE